ncbi:MAG: tRNA glutamyl-Q(34) synthetase GluQRS [Halioglobus sp.]
MAELTSTYRGRFAPSPTGPLHMGSLVAALASFLDARHQHGIWLVRIDDIDPPREQAGAAHAILDCLQQHGLNWDETVLWQSSRSAAYEHALGELATNGLLFRCDCTRATLGPNGSCNGRCEPRQSSVDSPWALRVRVPSDARIEFTDGIQGSCNYPLGSTVHDFVVQRKDKLPAYQLAAAVDDVHQKITHVVRGADLLDSTPRQLHLMSQLGGAAPHYTHIPLLLGDDGQKLSKQNQAPALVGDQALMNLRQALGFLNQPDPPRSASTVPTLVDFAIRHWARGRVGLAKESVRK